MKLVSPLNYSFSSQHREPISDEPSLTVPDMSIPLEVLVKRYTRGEQVTTFQPVYTDDPSFDNIEKMDPIERLEAAKHLKTSIQRHRDRAESAPVPVPPDTTQPPEEV